MARAKSKSTTDITSALHEDHQKVRELFFEFSKTEGNAAKEGLVKQILTELYIHTTVEEEIVYPATEKEADDAEDLIDEAETEHHVVKFLMAELSKMTAKDEQFDAKVTVLCELVNHHVREEEKEMFKKLRESGADLEQLAETAKARKEELKQQPLPTMNCDLSIGKNGKETLNRLQSPKTSGAKGGRKMSSSTKQRRSA